MSVTCQKMQILGVVGERIEIKLTKIVFSTHFLNQKQGVHFMHRNIIEPHYCMSKTADIMCNRSCMGIQLTHFLKIPDY